MEVPATKKLGKKRNKKSIQLGKNKVNLSLFSNDIILYIENPKDSIKKVVELINEYSDVRGYKIIYRNELSFYTLVIGYQKEKQRNDLNHTKIA